MNRHRNHQIDELAQRVFRDALPATWVCNEQHVDYAKDYLVEIGEDNGDLTGNNFFVQLKGQEHVAISSDNTIAKFVLESKHACYYYDRITDLPVFLVVVDVNKKRGWWLFLQKALHEDQAWRHKDTITLSLHTRDDLRETGRLKQAALTAKTWLKERERFYRSAFLRQCFDYLCIEQGLEEAMREDDGMVEQMVMFYFPSLPDGLPVYDVELKEWEFYGGSDPCNLVMAVMSDGDFVLQSGEEGYRYYDLQLKNPEELGEILSLLDQLREGQPRNNDSERVPLKGLIRSLDVVVPVGDSHALVAPGDLVKLFPVAGRILDAFADDGEEGWDYLSSICFSGWFNWCRDNLDGLNKIDIRFPDSSTFTWSRSKGLCSYRRWISYGDFQRDIYPAFALTRNRTTCSILGLHDLVFSASEGKQAILQLVEKWREFDKVSGELQVEIPVELVDQVRIAVESRMLRQSTRT